MKSSSRESENKTSQQTELYLNLKTSWYEIWETVRTWLAKSPHSQFGTQIALPNKLRNGSFKWSVADEKLKAVQITDVLTITYEKSRNGVGWTTTLYFKRARRSIYSHVTVEASQSDAAIKPPRIAPMLKRRFGQMNKQKKSNPRLLTDKSSEDALSEKIADKLRVKPLPARLVDVAPSAGKGLRAALKDPGGRPKKKSGGTKIATQGEMATSFGTPCTESKISNWEAYERTNGQRGSRPFGFVTKDGERIIYSAELRLNPTPDNEKRLTALIAEFQSRHRIKDAIGEKALHMKSPETLAMANGQAAAAIRERSQLKYEK